MEKEKTLKEDNKKNPYKSVVFIFLGVLLMGFAYAITTITDAEITTTGNITTANLNNILYVEAGNGSDIQVKINMCPSTGCLIILPPGNFTISEPIIINQSRLILRGSGYGTTIYVTNNGEDGIILGSLTSTETDYSGVENLRILGSSVLNGDAFNTGTSLLIQNHKKGNFKDLLIFKGNIGIHLFANGSGGTNTLNKFSNIEVSVMASTGILIDNNNAGDTTNFNNAQQFVNFYVHNNLLQMNLSRADDSNSGEVAHNQFTNGYFDEKNDSHDLLSIDGADRTHFVNTYFDGVTATEQIVISSRTLDTEFISSDIDCVVSDSGENTIYINLGEGARFTNLTVNTDDGGARTFFQRIGSNTQSMSLYVSDDDAIFESIQDENTGANGGFLMKMDSGGDANPSYKINHGGTTIFNISNDNDMVIGDGTNQKNITLTSPDGTEHSCGVNDGGTFTCV